MRDITTAMHAWVRTDIRFPSRRAIICIRHSWLQVTAQIESLLEEASKSADKLRSAELEIVRLIGELNPDLQNCCLHFIEFRFESDEWRIGISHPSLDEVANGAFCHQIRISERSGTN